MLHLLLIDRSYISTKTAHFILKSFSRYEYFLNKFHTLSPFLKNEKVVNLYIFAAFKLILKMIQWSNLNFKAQNSAQSDLMAHALLGNRRIRNA